jgi:mono/diheme cytochrome c family protein
MTQLLRRRLSIARACLLLVWMGDVLAQTSAPPRTAPELEQGRVIYRLQGCYECHGFAAQGAIGVAPALKPPRLTLEGFKAIVRKPGGIMPPYSVALVSDTDLELVFDYLQSLPRARRAADIPMLAPYVE